VLPNGFPASCGCGLEFDSSLIFKICPGALPLIVCGCVCVCVCVCVWNSSEGSLRCVRPTSAFIFNSCKAYIFILFHCFLTEC
jgi:hypothetical protein